MHDRETESLASPEESSELEMGVRRTPEMSGSAGYQSAEMLGTMGLESGAPGARNAAAAQASAFAQANHAAVQFREDSSARGRGMSGGGSGAMGQVVQFEKTAKEKANDQEAADDGHSLARHGPEVTDEALKTRLKTGMTAKIGDPNTQVFSPAPGIATKFKTYDDYLQTRQKATDDANTAIGVTKAGMTPFVEDWNTKKETLDNAKKALDEGKAAGGDVAALGRAFAQARAPLSTAEAAVRTHAGTYAAAATAGVSVSFKKDNSEVTGWDFLTLKPSYKCVVNHGNVIGVGFRGQDQKTVAEGNVDDDTIYNNVTAPFDVSTTQTAFSNTGGKKLADCDDSTEAQAWQAGQHYPCDPAEPLGISG